LGLGAAGRGRGTGCRRGRAGRSRAGKAYSITEKQARYARVGEIRRRPSRRWPRAKTPQFGARKVADEIGRLEYNIVRRRILAGEPRIDGRDMHTVRPITVQTGVLPRTHGSAVFTRGETQALVTTTLGTGRDAQIIDALSASAKSRSCCTTTSRRSASARRA